MAPITEPRGSLRKAARDAEPLTPEDVAYWRKQVAERKVDPAVPWPDGDVIALIARFLVTPAAATPEPPQKPRRTDWSNVVVDEGDEAP